VLGLLLTGEYPAYTMVFTYGTEAMVGDKCRMRNQTLEGLRDAVERVLTEHAS